jgi:hypothetical protein
MEGGRRKEGKSNGFDLKKKRIRIHVPSSGFYAAFGSVNHLNLPEIRSKC